MQNKGAIRLFAILLAIICIYYMSFTWIVKGVEKDAGQYAQDYISSIRVIEEAKEYAKGNATLQKSYLDSTYAEIRDSYLDSIKKKTVYNLGLTKFTYEEAKEKELNLGLDLQGGMNVTLEISVPDILKNLSNDNPDPAFNKAIEMAHKMQVEDNRDFVTLFGEAFKSVNPNGRLAPLFQTIELKDKITFNTPDEEVLALLRERVQESIATAENTLRARIDKFGVTQPSIQRLQTSGRILVELPGVSDKERVRKLLQGTANLEFWETYDNSEVYPMLDVANKRLRESLSPSDTSSSTPVDSSAIAAGSPVDIASPKIDTSNVDTAGQAGSLAQLGAGDSLGGGLQGDTSSAAKFMKENPLFAVLRPALYQDEKGNFRYQPGPVIGYVAITDTAKVNEYLSSRAVRNVFPNRMKFLWSFKPEDKEGIQLKLIAIKITTRDGKSPLSGDIITDARKMDSYESGGSPQISMSMTAEAAQVWKRLTADNIEKSIAIVLDDKVYSYPTVQGEIAGGTSSITGSFSVREADDLVNILRAGKLPAPARIVEEAVVGPTLGKEAINAGFLSFLIAFVVILIFMAFYYNKAGMVANIALFANVFFVIGVLASLGAVLTLPGIAGIVLTIGMAVDANILIFERVREEFRGGKGSSLAIREGFKHALSSILDSNITTILLGIVLYTFGTGPIQGFATTLIIGILTSLFCALFLSRLIFEWFIDKNKPVNFSIPLTENLFRNTKIDFIGKRKLYYLFSAMIISLGVVFFIKNEGFNLGVDFKGGRTYVVRFDKELPTQSVRTSLTGAFGMSPEVKTFGEGNQQKITTSFLIDDNSENAEDKVEGKLREGLDALSIGYEIMSSQKVGETISRDIRGKAIWAILFSSLIMFFYIYIRFKKWQYGLASVAALLHDVLIVLSIYTIFDGILPFSLEIDQHFIAAILAVMGYSMNDTVVVFDRIREYLTARNKQDMDSSEKKTVINYALNSTLSRTILTAATTFFVLVIMFIFGGEVIRGFTFALMVGIAFGTYSSLCISAPIVVDLDKSQKVK